jgi:trk system potassium uptake protein TrkH
MKINSILNVLGIFLMLFSVSMLPPAFIAYLYQDSSPLPYVNGFAVTLGSGICLRLLFSSSLYELRTRDGFLLVTLFWMTLCLFSAFPLMMIDHPHQSLTNALFESVSGFTTTGATILTGIDELPHALRYYRQQLQFLGGMGIIALAVAVLPMLGIGGLQLYRAETPGPVKDAKLTPRLTQTAKLLWLIYLGLTVACALSYYLAGMSAFDAIGESFATIATGGFSLHDDSFAYYNSATINSIAIVFMILGATNFTLHYVALLKQNLTHYWQDEEFKTFLGILVMASAIVFSVVVYHDIYGDTSMALVSSIFNVVSIATTTGFLASPLSVWPSFLPVFVLLLGIIGGCASSTTGGIKVMRFLLLKKQISREIQRAIHPQVVIAVKFGKQILPDPVLQAMWGFIAAFIGIFVLLFILLMATGLDLVTALGSLTGCLANIGIGLGQTAQHFADLPTLSKWILIFAMLIGRLEIFTLLVLLSPSFWRR